MNNRNTSKKKLKITEENCEGYAELFNLRYFNEEQNNLMKKYGVSTLAGTALMIPIIVFPAFFGVISMSFLAYETILSTCLFYKIEKIYKKNKQIIKEKYPYVDIKIANNELQDALKKSGILTIKEVNGIKYWNIDLDDFKRKNLSIKMYDASNTELPNCMKENISKKLNNSKSEQVMDEFMQKLENNFYEKSDVQMGEEFVPTDEFIEKTISDYRKLLDSGLVQLFDEESITKDNDQLVRRKNK